MTEQHTNDERPEDERPEDERPEDERPEDERPEDERPEDERPEDEHSDRERGRAASREAIRSATSEAREAGDRRRLESYVGWLFSSLLILPVRAYQQFISPLFGPTCRFDPTCSEYFIQAVRKYGPVRGAWRGMCRIARCHPFHPGGHDPP